MPDGNVSPAAGVTSEEEIASGVRGPGFNSLCLLVIETTFGFLSRMYWPPVLLFHPTRGTHVARVLLKVRVVALRTPFSQSARR